MRRKDSDTTQLDDKQMRDPVSILNYVVEPLSATLLGVYFDKAFQVPCYRSNR